MPPAGFLNLHKPSGESSRQTVDRVQHLVRPAKAGHAGTLDPLASGVLVVAVGAATRLIQRVQQQPKRYLGTFLLGRTSPTEDIEGQVAVLADPPRPTLAQIELAAGSLVGQVWQRPPAFSALKVDGRRAYALARKGQAVALAPRLVTVHRLSVVSYDYPALVLEVECGAGTYVRSLGRDLAESLGTAAVMSALVRTAVGGFTLQSAHDPRQLTRENLSDWLLPPRRAVEDLPALRLDAAEVRHVLQGRAIGRALPPGAAEAAALDAAGRLVAILVPRRGGLGPSCTFTDEPPPGPPH